MPRRACGAGGRGMGRRIWRASSAGSVAIVTSDDTDRRPGSDTADGGVAAPLLTLGEQERGVPLPRLRASCRSGVAERRRRGACGAPARRGARPAPPPRGRPRNAARPGTPARARAPARPAPGSPRRPPGGGAHRSTVPAPASQRGPDLVQEQRGAERGHALAPPVAGAGQPVRRPGHGDVRQPPFLGQLTRRAGLAERGQRLGGEVRAGPAGRPRLPAGRTGAAAGSPSTACWPPAWRGRSAPSPRRTGRARRPPPTAGPWPRARSPA